MVLSRVLVAIRDDWAREGGRPARLTVGAVHVDYGNRPESGREAVLVRRWCAAWRVPLWLRRIGPGLRRPGGGGAGGDREVYEEATRALRFAAYRAACAGVGGGAALGVCLGHHWGDVEENVVRCCRRASVRVARAVAPSVRPSVRPSLSLPLPLLSAWREPP